jgi:hypothetical protein
MVRSRTVRGGALPDDPFRYVCIISTASAAQWWSVADLRIYS